jgi:uncharacterized protein (TIRG00374 family)
MTASQAGRIATFVVSLTVLGVIVWHLDPQRVIRDFEGAHWGFVLATGLINLANTGIEAVRWSLLSKSAAPAVRVGSAFNGLLAGTLGNVVLPFKLGDGLRAHVFAEETRLPFTEALSTVVLDRMIDTAVFALVAVMTASAAPFPPAAAAIVGWLPVGAALGIGVLLVLARRARRGRRVALAPRGRAATHVDRFLEGLAALRDGGHLVPAIGVALLSWGTRMLLVWTMLRAFDISLPWTAPAVVLTILNLGIAVAGTPGNVGSFEIASMGGLAIYGVPADVALSFAAALHVTEILPVVTLGLLMMWSGRLQLRRPAA